MRKLFIFFIILLCLIGLVVLGRTQKPKDTQTIIPVIIEETDQPQKKSVTLPTLKQTVENALQDTKGIYGIAIKNLKTGESYYLNEHKTFESGSLYKIWVLATAFNQIENGKLKENEILSQEIAVLNEKFHIAQEEAEKKEGQITLSVKEAIDKMITISDNYSALLLSERLRLSEVKTFLQRNNLNKSSLGEPPLTTPSDITLFFEKLSKGELANQENTNKMLAILKRQTLNSKLPKYLPQKTIVAHKTGEIGNFSHDAGIVYTPSGEYIITVLSESNSRSQAEEQIAKMSQEVYNYFTKEKNN